MKHLFYISILSVSLSLLICTSTATAQVVVQWDKTLGGSIDDYLRDVISTPDGGYLLTGTSNSDKSGDKSEDSRGETLDYNASDYWIVKIDSQGNKQWDKTIGGNSYDQLNSTIQTPDGGYLLGGTSDSNASGDKSENDKGGGDYWIIKIDEQGNKIWDKTIGGSSYDQLNSTTQTPDGGYLLAGTSRSPASGDKSEDSRGPRDYWVVKVDKQGNKIWDMTFGGSSFEELGSIISTPDGGYLLAGTSRSGTSGDKSEDNRGIGWSSDYWIVKIDNHGNKQWDKTFGGNEDEVFSDLITTSEGGYLLAGYSNSPSSGDKSEDSEDLNWDYWIVKIDVNGNKEWDKTLGGNQNDYLQSVVSAPEGGYLLAGHSDSNASADKSEDRKGIDDYWVVKVDVQGNKQWDKTIGGDNYDYLSNVIPTTDGGYLLGGQSSSSATGDKSEDSDGYSDMWIVKLKPLNAPVVTSLTLINTQTGEEIRRLRDNDFINLAEVGNGSLNIHAHTYPEEVDSVQFALDGPVIHLQMDSILPYTLFGDDSGGFDEKKWLPGEYTLTVVPYTDGQQGMVLSVSFEMVENVSAPPVIEWDKTIGGSDGDGHSKAILTTDGGYLLGGTSWSNESGDKSEASKGYSDYWVIKVDAQGNKQWDKTIGGNSYDQLNSTIQTPDGGYLLGGTSDSNASGDKSENNKSNYPYEENDYWIVKIDSIGNKQWDKTIGGSGGEILRCILSTPDGGYLLAGSSQSSSSGDKSEDYKGTCEDEELRACNHDYWIVKIDAQGNKLWDKTLGGDETDLLQSILSTSDGGYLLAGSSLSQASGDKSENSKGVFDYWIVKIDNLGNKQWDKTIGGNSYDQLNSTTQTPDGGYLLGGVSGSESSGDKSENTRGEFDYWVVKIDAQGNKQWDKTIGGRSYEELSSIITTPDEGYLLAGTSRSDASGDKSEDTKGNSYEDYWIVKIDAQGNKHWDKTIGGNSSDGLANAISALDGGYLLAGSSGSDDSGDKSEDDKGGVDYWIVKLKGEDSTGVDARVASLTLVNAQTDEDIQELKEGDVINLAEVDCQLLSIRANTSPEKVDSVLFEFHAPASSANNFNDYQVVGDAFFTGEGCYTITPYEYGVLGAGWNKQQIDLNYSFDFNFTTHQEGEADGMMFVLQRSGLAVSSESGGSDLNYYTIIEPGNPVITPSIGIELDIYNSGFGVFNDPSPSHIALVKNADPVPINGPVNIDPILNNGEDRLFRVVWNSSTKQLNIYLEGLLVLSHTEDIVNTIFQGASQVYFGFTGATGASFALQSFCNEELIYNGPITTSTVQTERKLPYALFGDDPIPGSTARDYRGKHLEPGQYTLSATPYLNGQAGNVQTISFQVYSSLSVQSFNLVNAHDDEELQLLQDGDIIDLAMLPTRSLSIAALAENVGSIAFDLQGPLNHKQTENFAPHVLFGDNPRGNIQGELLAVGDYHLTATPYTSVNLQGNAGQSLSIHFSIINSDAMEEAVTAFMLYDATNDEQLMSLEQASVINLADLANRSLSVLALTHPEFVGSVKMELYGPINHTQIENTQPYALFRNEGQDFYGRVFPAGDYHLKATPYTKAHAQGEEGLPLDIYFTVAEEESNALLAVYPIPTSGLIDVHYQGKVEEAELNLIDFSGQILLTKAVKTQEQLDLSAYRKGIYYLKVISHSNVQIRRIILDN
ncbi:T9SS type A sorting domain-containing protein [Catalinimonas sp. 4WD22]|uniref:lectin-like domain-containing protein n=1 Tax=Catalinimonas locisalis TaxID=3133978 RepID=UPI003100FFFC